MVRAQISRREEILDGPHRRRLISLHRRENVRARVRGTEKLVRRIRNARARSRAYIRVDNARAHRGARDLVNSP